MTESYLMRPLEISGTKKYVTFIRQQTAKETKQLSLARDHLLNMRRDVLPKLLCCREPK